MTRPSLARPALAAALMGAALLTGCAKTYVKGPDFDVAAPQRVAVLPVIDRTAAGDDIDLQLSRPFTAVIDQLPVLGDDQQTPSTLLRRRLVAELERTRFDVINPHVVDQRLYRNDLFAAQKLVATDPGDLGQALGADMLLLVELVDWDRDYYLVESQVTVRARIRAIDVQTGRTVYDALEKETKNSGISGGPTGYTSAALAPLMGMSKGKFRELSSDLVRKLVDPLVPQDERGDAGAKPPYIAAAAHSCADGATLTAGDVFTVYAVGSPGAQAAFRLGPTGPVMPMAEFGAGRYRGAYVVQDGEQYAGTPILITLQKAGRRTRTILAEQTLTTR